MLEIKRKKGEPFDSFMRRTKRDWQRTGRIIEVKRRKRRTGRPSKNVQRKQAVKRAHLLSKLNYLRKTGRLKEEEGFGAFG